MPRMLEVMAVRIGVGTEASGLTSLVAAREQDLQISWREHRVGGVFQGPNRP